MLLVRIFWSVCFFYAVLGYIVLVADIDTVITGEGLALIGGIFGGIALTETDLQHQRRR